MAPVEEQIRPLPVIGRFISCGLLSLAMSLVWRLTLAPSQVGIGSTVSEVGILLAGFVIGGLAWYLRDKRKQTVPAGFSLIVFVIVPLAVIALLALVWAFAFFIG